MKKIILTILSSIAFITQTGAKDLIKEISVYMAQLNQPQLSYSYNILLVNEKSQITEDQLSGKLYKSGKYYLDSSARLLSMINEKYFVKMNNGDRTSMIVDLSLMKKKLGYEPDDAPVLVNVTDSMIRRYGKITVDSGKKKVWEYTVQFNTAGIAYCMLKVNPANGSIISMELAVYEPAGNGERFLRKCIISNIANTVPASVFDLKRFGSIKNNTVTLKGKYTNYKLTSLI